MNELEIANSLEERFGIPGLQVQVQGLENDLVVVFNRPGTEHLDYNNLTKKTVQILRSLEVPPPGQITFYSRVLGEEETDWDKTIKIKLKNEKSTTESNESLPRSAEDVTSEAKVNEPSQSPEQGVQRDLVVPEEPPIIETNPPKLSDFCFTRNKALIKTDLPAPALKVAQNVKFFHELSERTKLDLAPIMEDFFKSPDKTSLISVPNELRSWFEDLKKLKDIEFKSQSVWLSRYCFDPEKTMGEVNALFASLEELEKAKQQKLEPSPPPVAATNSSTKRSRASSVSSRSNVEVRGSQRFTPDELLFMIGGGLLIGLIGWFLWGTASAVGPLGWIAAFAGIASGIGTILGNQALRGISATVLIVVYIIFFGFGFVILWIEFLAWLTGLIVAGGVTSIAQSSGAQNITAPKPLRLLVVLSIVILIGMGYALTSNSSKVAEQVAPGSTGTPVDTANLVITNDGMILSNSALKTSFKMTVQNQASKPCDLDFELVGGGGYSVRYQPDKMIKNGETKTISFQFSNGGNFQLVCEGDIGNSNLLEISGPAFTIRDN